MKVGCLQKFKSFIQISWIMLRSNFIPQLSQYTFPRISHRRAQDDSEVGSLKDLGMIGERLLGDWQVSRAK